MDTFDDLLERIQRRRKRLGISKHPAWYRGHRMNHYKLVPSVLRYKTGSRHERNIYARFGTEGAELLNASMSSWERLAIMQHHGVPTRLLDWTESVHAALFFATLYDLTLNVGRPCIWILNPFRLNRLAVGQNLIFDQDDILSIGYYESIRDDTWPYKTPIAMAAPWRNARVKAQKGVFTFHGNDPRPLDEVAPNCAVRVDIPPHLVRDVIRGLNASAALASTAEQRREVEKLASALFDEQQALQARQRLMDEGRSVIERTRTATEQHAAEVAKLNELLAAGAIDLTTYARAVEDANDRALRSSQAWTDGAARFLKDYVAESNDAATATEQAFANAFSGAEDSLVGFIASGKLEFKGLADSILADLARTTVRQTITAPLAGALQSAFAGGGLFGLFHQGGVAGERPPAVRYADAAVFGHASRYHSGGLAGSGLLPDEVPIIARRGELVVPPERVVREEKTAREQRPITVVVNVTAADAGSFRASQGQIAADMARAIDRASRNR